MFRQQQQQQQQQQGRPTDNAPRAGSIVGDGVHEMIAEESESQNSGGSDSESDTMSNATPKQSPRSSLRKSSSPKKSKKKSKKGSKKLKKGFKKAFKMAATPVMATGNAVSHTASMASNRMTSTASNFVTKVTGDQHHIFDQPYKSDHDRSHESSSYNNNNNTKGDKKSKKESKKKKKDYVADSDDDDLLDLDVEVDGMDNNTVSMVKYEKVKGRLIDKSHLVDTLLSKIQLLQETIAEKDEVILRLQNLDILASTIREKEEIIRKLMANEKVDQSLLTVDSKSNADVLSHIRTKKMDLELHRQSYRRLSTDDAETMLGGEDSSERNDDTFIAWQRLDNELKSGRGVRSVPMLPQGEMSRATSAQLERSNRLESSDVLHKMRKANKKKNSPKKKGAEPWKAMHTFLMPHFERTVAEKTLISKALLQNYIFESLGPAKMDTFIQAFDEVQFKKGDVIMQQGEKVDHYYIVAEGEISIEKNDETKRHGPATGFGATALLYASPPKTTVIAESEPTKMFRVDEKTFRYTMKRTVKETNRQKMTLLRDIPELKSFDAADLQRLCDNMLDRKFAKGEEVISQDQSTPTFYVVMSGAMTVTANNSPLFKDGDSEKVIKKGGCFGLEALTKTSSSPIASLVGQKAGWCFGIDSATFEKVLGKYSVLITKTKDKAILQQVKLIKDAKLEDSVLNSLAEAIVPRFFEADSIIQEIDEICDAALYIVREGSCIVDTKTVKAGEFFGEDQLLADINKSADPKGKIIAKFTAMCSEDVRFGVLTLTECRLLFDTAGGPSLRLGLEAGPGDALGGRKRMDHRAIIRRRSIGMSMGVGGNSGPVPEDFNQDFVNERLAIRAFYKGFKTEVDKLPRDTVLGEGQFGQVWKVTLREGELKEDFALKIQDLGDAYQNESLENIYREMKVIKQLQHPFIVDLIDSKETDTASYMLMTLCTGGELWSVVHKKNDDGKWQSGMNDADAKFYSIIIADTLAYMHRKNVLFRDLKPENVLLDAGGYPNIIDFGFAKITTEKTYTLCGTPNYMAPEIILISGHHVGADHWALGIMIYELLSGEHPFYYEGLNNAELFDLVTKTEAFPCEKASPEAQSLMNGLLEKDPTQRLGVLAGKERDILRHAWFKDLDLVKVRKRELKAPWIPPPP
ncbi:unnamed protein product [Cylindrotheca closterium]|uniref:cGMP-dependent protein kinase n=1 Tax=Cylindrotheca closterium TaxID=2856 RepID=A0AAD2CP33_9STRA|nr:unnamed protein product [Cylindrotheca closterium]